LEVGARPEASLSRIDRHPWPKVLEPRRYRCMDAQHGHWQGKRDKESRVSIDAQTHKTCQRRLRRGQIPPIKGADAQARHLRNPGATARGRPSASLEFIDRVFWLSGIQDQRPCRLDSGYPLVDPTVALVTAGPCRARSPRCCQARRPPAIPRARGEPILPDRSRWLLCRFQNRDPGECERVRDRQWRSGSTSAVRERSSGLTWYAGVTIMMSFSATTSP
jgi:hypothetical protein